VGVLLVIGPSDLGPTRGKISIKGKSTKGFIDSTAKTRAPVCAGAFSWFSWYSS
jgi:hypothetical protein